MHDFKVGDKVFPSPVRGTISGYRVDPRRVSARVRGDSLLGGHRVNDSSTSSEGPNPSGLCMCGCGGRTRTAPKSRPTGEVKGQPVMFINGHPSRTSPVDYLVDPATGCWVWQQALDPYGYGKAYNGSRRRGAHRVYYERASGPIPAGLELDHLCRNRACVNPAHLEPVTHAENMRRSRRSVLAQQEGALL